MKMGWVEEEDVGACANVDTTGIDAGQDAGAMGNAMAGCESGNEWSKQT